VCFGCEIEALVAEMACPGDPASNLPLTTQHVLHGLWETSPALAGYLQQDSQEFFSALVNALHAHTTCEVDGRRATASGGAGAAPADGGAGGTASGTADLPREETPTAPCSPSQADRNGNVACTCVAHASFGGVLRSRVECTACQHASDVFEAFFDISLDVPSAAAGERGAGASLEGCLSTFVAPEVVSSTSATEPCAGCGARADRRKRYAVRALPDVLALHLKRFESTVPARGGASDLRKTDAFVTFPLAGLDVRPYVSADLCACQRDAGHARAGAPPPPCDCFRYDLVGMVEHTGELGAGHYVSFVKSGGAWFRFDDSLIARVAPADVSAGQAYMLFYTRRGGTSAVDLNLDLAGGADGGADDNLDGSADAVDEEAEEDSEEGGTDAPPPPPPPASSSSSS